MRDLSLKKALNYRLAILIEFEKINMDRVDTRDRLYGSTGESSSSLDDDGKSRRAPVANVGGNWQW